MAQSRASLGGSEQAGIGTATEDAYVRKAGVEQFGTRIWRWDERASKPAVKPFLIVPDLFANPVRPILFEILAEIRVEPANHWNP